PPRKNGQSPSELDGRPCCDHCCCRHGALPPGVAGAEGGEVVAEPKLRGCGNGAVPAPRFGTKSYARTWVIWLRSGKTPSLSRLMPMRTFIGLYCNTSRVLRGPILSALQISVSKRWPISTACWVWLVSVTFWKIFLPLCAPSAISSTPSM